MSLEFIRQGKSAEETATLIKNSTMMSKLGNMEAIESSEALTAIMNGYNLKVEETGAVVSKLVALDNTFATSVKEISTAMKYASSISKEAGIDYDHLAAYIAVTSHKTRQSAETIGQSIKTMESRMISIKNMKAFDDEGEAINDVESSLKRVNIDLRDSNGHFRDLQDVIGEITSRWSEFGEEDRKLIASKIGGTRQIDKTLALLGSQLELEKALKVEKESTGLADERYKIFLEGVEAAQGRLTAEWEKLAQSGATVDLVTDMLDLATATLEVLNYLGGIQEILMVISPGIGALLKTVGFVSNGKKTLSKRDEGMKEAVSKSNTYEEYVGKARDVLADEGLSGQAANSVKLLTKEMYEATKMTDRFVEATGKIDKVQESLGFSVDLSQKSKQLNDYNKNFQKLSDTVGEFGGKSTDAYDALQTLLGADADISKYLTEEGAVDFKKLRDEQTETLDGLMANVEVSKDMSESQKEAIRAVVDESRNALAEYEVLGYQVSQGTFLKIGQDLSNELAKMVDETGISLNGINGEVLSGSANIFSYLKQYPAQMNILIQQLVASGVSGARAVAQAFANTAASSIGAISMPSLSSILGVPSGGGGGGGGGGGKESAAKARIDGEVKALEDKKKALQDMIDEFKRYIDAQKESLKLQKEEKEYSDDLLKKNKSLAKLKADIAILSLDNSEEAKAKRLALEEDALALEEEITEDSEDRKYELQIDALDKLQKDFEDNIKQQMDGIDDKIDKYKDEASAIDSVSSSVGGTSSATQSLGAITQETGAKILDAYSKQLNLSQKNRDAIQQEINKMIEKGESTEVAALKIWELAQAQAVLNAVTSQYSNPSAMGNEYAGWSSTPSSSSSVQPLNPNIAHPGRHSGGFAGDLKSNEVFEKLLKGELIVTEGQMNTFMRSTLPSLMGAPSFSSNSSNGDISVSMPINVSGNLDSSVIPDIEKIANGVMKQINNAMLKKGFNRRADMFSV